MIAMPHLCAIDGCERKRYAKGWCKGHYQRWHSTGDTGPAEFRPIGVDFWERLDKSSSECWLWTGANIQGYGVLHVRGRRVRAHRYAYEMAFGEIPPGMDVCHACDTPPCCNPAHLFVGTRADNMRDMVAKGRQGRPNPKLRPEQIPGIRADSRRHRDIAAELGVSPSLISRIKTGRAWRTVA